MAQKRNTKLHNIFLLDREKVQEEYFGGEETSTNDIIDKLLVHSTKRYYEQELKEDACTEKFCVRLFFHYEEGKGNRLASFCKTFVKDNQEILKVYPKTISSVMFIWSNTHIFVITTGQGFRVIDEFCVPRFGILVASTFKNLFRIVALDSNGMSSIVHSSKIIYANEIDFLDIDALDTVFKEVTGRLNDRNEIRNLLQLGKESKKKSMKLTAKNYVQFSSSLDYKGLLHILTLLDEHDYSILQDGFNLVSPIDSRRNTGVVLKNNEKVIEKMYQIISAGVSFSFGFDLFNRDVNEFIAADRFLLYTESSGVLAETGDIIALEFVRKAYEKYLDGKESSLDIFTEFVNEVKLQAIKDENVVTDGKLLKHISGEIEVDNKNYYIFYGEYYYLNQTYNERLDKALESKLKSLVIDNVFKTEWNVGETEDDFNRNVSEKEGYIHLHKIKPELVEFADLLKVDEGGITVVHVKDGFDNDMRALDRQVDLSVRRVLDLKNNNNDHYMKSLYQNASKSKVGRNISEEFHDEDAFVKAMKEKKINFMIVIRPHQKELIKNRSNIAKHCLNALILRCYNKGVELKISIL